MSAGDAGRARAKLLRSFSSEAVKSPLGQAGLQICE